jgi:glucosamine-6-phosphate deaminase
MKMTFASGEAEFDLIAAWRIIGQILRKKDSVIGLSTGKTTKGMHGIVSAIHKKYPFDVSGITLFNVDELTNVPRDYPGSCYSMILHEIAGPLGISDRNFIMPPTVSADFTGECRLFEKELDERGGTDLQILGIGLNGHIGINQPGTPFESETWISVISPDTDIRVRKDLNLPRDVIIGGLARGIKNIMGSRRIILAAKGEHKAEIIARALLGPVTTDVPASVLQLHPDCEVLLDEAASGAIKALLKKSSTHKLI